MPVEATLSAVQNPSCEARSNLTKIVSSSCENDQNDKPPTNNSDNSIKSNVGLFLSEQLEKKGFSEGIVFLGEQWDLNGVGVGGLIFKLILLLIR